MGRVAIAALSLALCIPMAFPQKLKNDERRRAAGELEASRKLLLQAVAGLSEAQWHFKPAPDRWSAAECVEHIALAEDGYYELIQGKLLKSPADESKRAEVAGKDEEVLRKMPDRSSKRVTSAALEPKGRWQPREAIAHFEKSRDRLIQYVLSTQDDLREHFQPHRAVGLIDGYQWILLASGHVRRHVEQIAEVKANAAFPRQ